MIRIISGIFLFYYAVTVLSYWVPLLGYLFGNKYLPAPPVGDSDSKDSFWPYLIAVAPTRSAASSIKGMVETLQHQDYPAHRFRTIILVDPEGPEDPSTQIAKAAGAEVFERKNVHIRTKGAGLNELLASLRSEPFDALIILDIDVRVDRLFFRKIAAHLKKGAVILQGVPVGKNARRSDVTRLSEAAQGLANMIQQGRTALSLPAVLSGTGMVFSRQALEVLEWQTSTGAHISDDGELNLRCYLKGLETTYAPDLLLQNDLPEDVHAVRMQRRRWMAAYAELIPPYTGRLLRKAMSGKWRVLEGTFNLLFLPSCSLSLVCAGMVVSALFTAVQYSKTFLPWLEGMAILCVLHSLYYVLALRVVGFRWSFAEIRGLPQFLVMRAVAIWSGLRLACRPNPGEFATPAAHSEDASTHSELKEGALL